MTSARLVLWTAWALALAPLASCAANLAPEAVLRADPAQGPAPLTVTFDARASSDPDGTVIDYRWALGNGTSAQGARVTHTFERPGDYRVRLRVRDGRGASDEATTTVRVGAPRPACFRDSAENADFRLTLRNVETNEKIARWVPHAGNRFVIVDLEVRALSPGLIVSRRFFALETAGRAYFHSLATDWVNDPFRSAQLEPGAATGGRLVYDVPRAAEEFVLRFFPFEGAELALCFSPPSP